MNRQQTQEYKGFIQLVILIFRASSAQKNIPLFMLIRLFASSYLFLSGYGHFMYYWNTSNYSITRFFEVLFRYNFLPIMLCFTMNRMYQFYSFIPLITFWFVCCYILMIVYPRVSAKSAKDNSYHYFYMMIKLCTFGGFITFLNMSEVLFEKIFVARPWKFLFVGSDDLIQEWRYKWSHDCYSFLFGMFFALIISILKRMNFLTDVESDDEFDNLEIREKKKEKNLPTHIKIALIFLSLCGLSAYTAFAYLCKSKEECDSLTPYITVIPIISYIILRNTIEFLREKFSYMFTWFGKISLELFVCSYHIWLAADSNGILVLVPGYPVLNMLVTTYIFICIAHELNSITKTLSQFFVPNNWRTCLRNFILFIISLMPIAIKYGYI